MITKQEQEILDNAPEGKTHHLIHDSHSSAYAVKIGNRYFDKNPDDTNEDNPHGAWFNDEWHAISLADLRKKQEPIKPRMKVEYIECENLQSALNDFESHCGCGFYGGDDGKHKVTSVKQLAWAYGKSALFRKVKTEITWQDEAKLFLNTSTECVKGDKVFKAQSINMFEADFLELCHLVSSMNKP